MKEKKMNFLGNFFPGIGLGFVISYEDGVLYLMGVLPFYQFYLDINFKNNK